MSSKKVKRALEIYHVLGHALCATAGAMVGFVVGGPAVAVGGIVIGVILSHILGKHILKLAS